LSKFMPKCPHCHKDFVAIINEFQERACRKCGKAVEFGEEIAAKKQMKNHGAIERDPANMGRWGPLHKIAPQWFGDYEEDD